MKDGGYKRAVEKIARLQRKLHDALYPVRRVEWTLTKEEAESGRFSFQGELPRVRTAARCGFHVRLEETEKGGLQCVLVKNPPSEL